VAALLMVFVSFAVAFAFHAMRGMYLHAERLLAKAGRQSARGGVSPTRSKAEDERSEGLHKRSAEDCWETPCAAPGQSPQRGLVSSFVRISAHDFQGRRCGQDTGPHGWEAETTAPVGGWSVGRAKHPSQTIRYVPRPTMRYSAC